MNNIEIFNETKKDITKELDTVKNILLYACEKEKLENVEFNIIIVDNKFIHELNRTYRNIDRVTDVITFALEDDKQVISVSDKTILGDVYISIDKALEQSIEYGHSFLRELSFLAVHGFYHLLGYDHQTEEEEKVMFTKQEEVLSHCGIERKEKVS